PQPSPANLLNKSGSRAGHVQQDHVRGSKGKASVAQALSRAVDGDFYKIAQLASPADQALIRKVRTFAEEEIAPVITQYLGRAEFPFELISAYGAVGIAGALFKGYGCLGASALADGLVMLELARIDCSIATFHGVHSGLAMGSIYLCGSQEQKQ